MTHVLVEAAKSIKTAVEEKHKMLPISKKLITGLMPFDKGKLELASIRGKITGAR